MNNYQSIATINGPEFINLQPLEINPGMAKCEIKVLYLGPNRNGTSIDKAAATQMAKTLRGAPIVGYYRDDKEDFFDHGEQLVIDGDGVHFNVLTKPYGFVSPDAQVWFQEFEEFNEAGESINRVYLMTTGYLWVGQFKEAQQVLNDGGKPHSMELDENSLSGFWSKEENSDFEFFIINDAVFSKLCILGDDVEPCFEGSSVTAPNISKSFTLDDNNFRQTLYTMMKELQETLQGGNYKVADEIKKKSVDSSEVIVEEEQVEPVQDNSSSETPDIVENPDENGSTIETPAEGQETQGTEQGEGTNTDNPESAETEGATEGGEGATEGGESGESGAGAEGGDSSDGGSGSTDYAKKDDEEGNKAEDTEDKADDSEEDDDKKKEDKYALLVIEHEELQKSYSSLQAEHDEVTKQLAELKSYVAKVEDEKKDALIADFYMLSDEDKKDVIEHKSEYTLDEIKSKLAVLCYDKKVSYVKDDESTTNMTVNINTYANDMPDWLSAVEEHKKAQQ